MLTTHYYIHNCGYIWVSQSVALCKRKPVFAGFSDAYKNRNHISVCSTETTTTAALATKAEKAATKRENKMKQNESKWRRACTR